MSVNGSLSGISFGGLSSGIDTESIITRLMQLEAIPIQRMQNQQQALMNQQSVMGQLRSKITTFSGASAALNSPDAFNPIKANSSDSAVASVSGSAIAGAGTYQLSVSKLAQAQKLASAAQQSVDVALGQTGDFAVNGKIVRIGTSDSLREIARKINASNAGVTASLIDGGEGSAYLSLTAQNTGAANGIQLADVSGGVLQNLGVLGGGAGVREPIAQGALSVRFASASEVLGTMMGPGAPGAGTIQIDGVEIAIDPGADSLQTLADRINASAWNGTATVESAGTGFRLKIVGDGGTPAFVDDQNLLGALGVLQRDYGQVLVSAQDAEYSLDGIALKSSTNTISSVIPGVTLTLLSASESVPKTANLTLTRDDSAIKQKIKSFQDAFNGVIEFIRTNSAFDKETFASGPLFGNATAQQVESELQNRIFSSIPGLSGAYRNLTAIGFGLDSDGKLTLDESRLDKALTEAPDAVSTLFRANGVSSGEGLTYVFSTSKTLPSGAEGYGVEITQLATQSAYTAELAQTASSVESETLTFQGAIFGGTPYTLTLGAGSTLSDAVQRINGDPKLRDLVSATVDGGMLKLISKRYGSASGFSVTSSLAAASNNTGLGQSSAGVSVLGVDVAGTIGGQPATGIGQFLTGADGAERVAGLQIQYTGSTLGLVGSIRFTKGIAAEMNGLLNTFTDSVGGLLSTMEKGMQDQIDEVQRSIERLQERLSLKEQQMRERFSRMEEAIAGLQAQSSRLSALSASGS